MEDSEKFQAISSQAENPRQWLAAYLRDRADLASYIAFAENSFLNEE